MEKRYRWAYRATLVVAAATLWTGLASVPLLDPDESRFARTSVEMLHSHDFVVPHFEGRPRLVKPPLVHWIQAALFQLFGANEWSARLHAVLATLGTIAITAWVARRRFGEEGGLWAAACLATMPLVIAIGRVGSLDAFLALHVFAVVALDIALPEQRQRYRGLLVGALLGLAFLVKGPVGVVLPLIAMLAGRTLAGRELLPRGAAWLQGLAGWAVVVLPWGLAFAARVGGGAAGGMLRREVLDRVVSGTAHIEPPWFYLLVLAAGCFPWWPTLLAALWRLVRERQASPSTTARYAAAGLIAGTALLSLSRGKLPTYFLPLTPLVALVCAWEIGRQLASPARRRPAVWFASAQVGYALLFVFAGLKRPEPAARMVAFAGAGLFLIGALLSAWGIRRRRPRVVYGGAAASAALFLILVAHVLHPAIGDSRSARGLIDAVPQLRSRPVVRVSIRLPSLTYYLDRVPEQVAVPDLRARLQRGDAALYVISDVDRPTVPQDVIDRLHAIGGHGRLKVYELLQ